MDTNSRLKLEGQNALVTGSASGIGRAIALELARNGASLALNDRSTSEELASLTGEIRDMGRGVLELPANVSDPGEVGAMFAEIQRSWGRLNILINNAGIHCRHKFLDIPCEEWTRVLAINLTGYFLCGQAAARMMAQGGGGGRIVCISSPTWEKAPEGMLAYSVTKGGVNTLFRGMAKELAPYRIRVNAIEPGGTPTGLNREIAWVKRAAAHPFEPRSASGRNCTPEDIAQAALFLVSEEASNISGTCIRVDGALAFSNWPED